MIGAQNSCVCSYHGDAERECSCSPAMIARYSKRISGPLLDHIDIYVDVPHVQYEKLRVSGWAKARVRFASG